MKMPFLMQVVLLGFISTTCCVFRLPPPVLFTDENDECQAEPDPPPSVADHFIAWQPRTSTSAASLQKPPSPGGQSGHATASNAIMKMPFLMQVVLLGFISTTCCVFRLPSSNAVRDEHVSKKLEFPSTKFTLGGVDYNSSTSKAGKQQPQVLNMLFDEMTYDKEPVDVGKDARRALGDRVEESQD
ncbi:hypothetical protein MRX96_034199 [Rhipicephalus microplus]